MRGFAGHWRARLLAPAIGLAIVGAGIAPAATPSQAQGWGPWGPLLGWDLEFPGPIPGPLLGPGMGPGPLVEPSPLLVPGPMPAPNRTTGTPNTAAENQALATHLRQMRSIARGNGADAMSLFADEAVYWVSDGVGGCSATPCVGREAIRSEVERQIGLHSRFVPLGGDVDSSVVTGLWEIRSDRVTAAGSERLLGVVTSDLRGDRVASLRIALVRDDPQTLRFITWLQTQPAATAAGQASPGAVAPTTTGAAAPTAPFAGPTAMPTPMPAMPPSAPPATAP
jgi:hypothetical protein